MLGQTFDLIDIARVIALGFIEILLSADNAIVLGVLSRALPEIQRRKALYIGVISAFFLRAGAIFLVSFILKKLGTGFCLTSSAAAIFFAVVAFALLGNPLIIVTVFHLDEGMRHAWFKSAKELTYTVTSRDVLYNVKPVIEMFFYRFSRGFAGVAIYLVNNVLHLGAAGVMVLCAACAITWIWAGVSLTREFARLEETRREEESKTLAVAV